MKRFLRRTYEQNKNFEINLTEAEVVLKEVSAVLIGIKPCTFTLMSTKSIFTQRYYST